MREWLTWRFERAAYRTQHVSLRVQSELFEQAARTLGRMPLPRPPHSVVRRIRRRFRRLLDHDLHNVERGLYGRDLLFQMPLGAYARALPALLADAPRTIRRMRAGNYHDLPSDVALDRYPPYYRRNFHWQSDGYFSERSARLYDLGVEVLFRGMADVMRRQIIPPITRFVQEHQAAGRAASPVDLRVLDIGCGTGRTLRQLAVTHPTLRYHGVDLSPFYIRAARKLLADVTDLSLLVENAEALPYVADYFDVAISVYLFHELPRNARRRVLAEAFRVLRPGGLLVLEDSAQHSDSDDIAEVLANFARNFHEPFYRCYLRDDLAAMTAEAGFAVESTETHLVSKVVVARKPAARS